MASYVLIKCHFIINMEFVKMETWKCFKNLLNSFFPTYGRTLIALQSFRPAVPRSLMDIFDPMRETVPDVTHGVNTCKYI